MLEALISSKTRINLLLKFFLNPETTSYLRELATEFNESTNAIRIELNRFESAGLLDTAVNKNKKIFKANTGHPLYNDIRNIILKFTGINQVLENVIKKLGNPEKVFLTGDFAKGMNTDIIDIIIVGDVNEDYLIKLIRKAEEQIDKRIRYLVYTPHRFETHKPLNQKVMLLWSA
ncbi:MAG: ArsR family transcriptional regulator [Bacteroidetes bacterium]|jgi:predicted nucleotidyltransferase|nr:ArsR family transcriptional regulator [Bacteroidota bacterium]